MASPVQAKAARAKALREDPAFAEFIQEVRSRQVDVFLNAESSSEARDEAHAIIRAVGKIEAALKSAETDWAFEQKKGQHRGHD
ncbi:hypothetical protein PE067_16250 [Paracoccus sp. DMF-8]|uniref:hypothetical protein n=1 Tax=Paracoccus sp. DMF-8 TaxID=3019445 RepID=UPI0023E36C6F|nr:hypothetical protein [Paracoccus sp. DMF-8]MDF3607560.1 hypothetical protein [Paracoccus sp. DMF-8]